MKSVTKNCIRVWYTKQVEKPVRQPQFVMTSSQPRTMSELFKQTYGSLLTHTMASPSFLERYLLPEAPTVKWRRI